MKLTMVIMWAVMCACTTVLAQAPTAGELAMHRELIELRDELKSLRADIQILVKALKPAASPESDTPPVALPTTQNDPPFNLAGPGLICLPARTENPNNEPRLELEQVESVELTLDECVEMALSNMRHSTPSEKQDNSQNEVIYKTKVAFWQLWGVHREWETMMEQHINSLILLENCRSQAKPEPYLLSQLEAWVTETSPSAKLHRLGRYENIRTLIQNFENQLRDVIGWAQASPNERPIKPMVSRMEAAEWRESWETTKLRALENNPELQSIRQKLSVLKTELSESKEQVGYEYVKLAETVRQKAIALTSELVLNWRLLDSQREQARIYLDQATALADEIRVYRTRLLNTPGDRTQCVDLLRRAAERLAHANRHYCLSLQESHKCVAMLEYYVGK